MAKQTKILWLCLLLPAVAPAQTRARELGIRIGVLPPGSQNAITDVAGVRVGHTTLVQGASVRTGVTVVIPHGGNIFQNKVPAAIFVGNGFGKLAGSTQVKELGNLETPVALTNTLSVPAAMEGLIEYTLREPGNENVRSVNAVVGETNDGYLNDIRGRHVKKEHVLEALRNATTGRVAEGNVGAGTGTVCFGFKGGIGASSRKLPKNLGGYTVGVLVQTNFGGVLQIDGAPVGEELKKHYLRDQLENADGSCMIVVATDAPVDARNLERLAQRAIFGLAKTGGIASNGSGDYVIAFSTHEKMRVRHESRSLLDSAASVRNDAMSPLFLAAIEATEEAIINSLLAAKTMTGHDNRTVEALPRDEVLAILRKYSVVSDK
jgi:D-aminopeptidase